MRLFFEARDFPVWMEESSMLFETIESILSQKKNIQDSLTLSLTNVCKDDYE